MEEASYVSRSIRYIESNPDCFERQHLPLHVTVSAWVVNPSRDRVLMVHHGKLHHWLQPGGHADGESDVLAVALKETSEETGLPVEHIHIVTPEVFDVDIHWIPTINTTPAHGHIDLRFLVEIDDLKGVPGNSESHEVRWVDLHRVPSLNNFRSIWRMVEKTRRMRRWSAV